jgi:hypothetical protein
MFFAPFKGRSLEERMDLDVENLSDTGVTITEVEAIHKIPVNIKPGAVLHRITIPGDCCTISVTLDDHGTTQTSKRPSPVTGGTGKITIMKNSAGTPYVQ